MRIFFISLLSCSFILAPLFTFAETASQNIGLVEHTIWYSKDPFYEGDTIKIYTLLYNSATSPVSGTVEFYDGRVTLGKKDVLISPESAKDVSISWVVTAGDHSISAKFLNPTMAINGTPQPITVENDVSAEQKVFVPKKVVSESKKVDGDESAADNIVDQFAEKVSPYTPEPIDQTAIAIDTLRAETSVKIDASKETTKARVEAFNDSLSQVSASGSGISVSSHTLQKPLAYISLFFWSVLSFIFSHKAVFYGLILAIIILIIRAIWKRFHN